MDQVKTKIESEFVFTLFHHPQKQKLFSTIGRKKLQSLSDELTYLHWDHKSSIIRIYGSDIEKKEAETKLKQIINEFDGYELEIKIPLKKNSKGLIFGKIKECKEKIEGILDIYLHHSKLVVSAKGDAIEKIKNQFKDLMPNGAVNEGSV